MTKNEYNGWTNYETWNVKLWMDNDEGSNSYWVERAEALVEKCGNSEEDRADAATGLAEEIKDQFEESNPLPDSGVYTDLLNAALSEVNWFEIAESYVSGVEIEEEETEEA